MHGTGEPLGRFTTELPEGAHDHADAVAAVLFDAQRVLVCGNTGADGDVAGSTLALRLALQKLGKDGADERFDATVVVDCAQVDRLGRTFPSADRRGVYCWIDHHKNDAPPGDVNFIDLTAAAVGEQIALVLEALQARVGADRGINLIDVDVARCLYALRLAARLVEAGVDPWEMTERIYESQDEARVRLLGRALDGLVRSSCGRLGVVHVRVRDLVELGAVEEHVQGLVNSVRAIKGVEIAALVRELSPEQSRVIFRSRGNIAVTPIAVGLGGKGTKNAGSAVIGGDLQSVSDVVVAAAQAHLRTLETMPGGNAE